MKTPALLGALLGLGPLTAHAQSQLSGRVLDGSTHQPVPYASVVVAGTTQGTTSNAEGEFILSVRQLPVKVLAFSLGYGRDSATVAQAGPTLTLHLAPAPVALPAVEGSSYAASLLTKAYRVLQRTNAQRRYGEAFYRQLTYLDQRPTQLLEMVWQVRANSAGLDGSVLSQGRFAEKQDKLIGLTNLSAFTKGIVLYGTTDDTTKFGNVLSASPTANYTLRLVGISQGAGQQLAEVEFQEKAPGPTSQHVSGTLTIETDTYQVLRYRVGFDVKTHTNNPTFKPKGSRMQCDFVFVPHSGGAIPDHFTTTLTENMGRLLKSDVQVRAVGYTYFHDWQPAAPATAAYAPANGKLKDLDAIKQKPYDAAYWRANPVVKRTPLEEEAIKSFEQEKAFGTLLNK